MQPRTGLHVACVHSILDLSDISLFIHKAYDVAQGMALHSILRFLLLGLIQIGILSP